MRVLVACESSGVVREAFRSRGHDAWSNDLLPPDDGSPFHFQTDCRDAIRSQSWDLIIAHPECTHLAVSGNRWHANTEARRRAAEFVISLAALMTQHARAWAIENPVGALSTLWRKPDQYIQPWQHGHGEVKKTGLWLHNLPLLRPTVIVDGREARIWRMGPSPDRWKQRSRTYPGIADAFATQ